MDPARRRRHRDAVVRGRLGRRRASRALGDGESRDSLPGAERGDAHRAQVGVRRAREALEGDPAPHECLGERGRGPLHGVRPRGDVVPLAALVAGRAGGAVGERVGAAD
jgi:hypothetical protein